MHEDVPHRNNLPPRHTRNSCASGFRNPRGGLADLLDRIRQRAQQHRVAVEVASRTTLDVLARISRGLEHVFKPNAIVDRLASSLTRHAESVLHS